MRSMKISYYSLVSFIIVCIGAFSYRLDGNVCFDPCDFGAIEGNPQNGLGYNWQSNTVAIQSAIDAAASVSTKENRNCVVITGGDYVSSDIYLRSNIIFVIEKDSRLLTAVNKTIHGLILVSNISDVEIRGPGVLYGSAEKYISYYDSISDRFEPTFPDGSRPRLLYMEFSQNIVISNLYIQNASDWHIHLAGCENVSIDSVSISGDWRYPNNDGIDIDSSINVSIKNSDINVANDGVCLKSTNGFGVGGNITVANLRIRSKSHAIKFGSVCDTEISNLLFENISIWDSNSGLGIQQRSSGDIHNVTFRNIKIESRYVAPSWWGNGEWLVITAEERKKGDRIGKIYDIFFENIIAVSENGGLVSAKYAGISNVSFSDVQVNIVQWSNYSTFEEQLCERRSIRGNSSIACMGSQDHRPSFTEDINCLDVCRIPSQANGIFFENAHDVVLNNVSVAFGSSSYPNIPTYAGQCLSYDKYSSNITFINNSFQCSKWYI